MNILQNKLNIFIILILSQILILTPVFALDFDTTVNDDSRKNYTNSKPQAEKRTVIQAKQDTSATSQQLSVQQINTIEKVPLSKVPAIPKQTNSSTVAPINTMYSGKVPNSEAIVPCSDIKSSELIIDDKYSKSIKHTVAVQEKSKDQKAKKATSTYTKPQNYTKYRTTILAKGTQVRATNTTKLSDSMYEGQTVTFLTTQEIYTSKFKIPAKTKLTVRIADAHMPQITCNGGLIGLKVAAVNINGYNQPVDASIIKIKTDNVYFSNLKGKHTYWKTTGKKAKWGQNIYKKWSNSAKKLANKGACIIIAPFPYVAGLVTVCASTVTSPVTALLGKGERIIVPPNTTFTIKINEDANIRY